MAGRVTEFRVRRADLAESLVESRPAPRLDPGQVRLVVERFAFTANNVSYAVAGDTLGYWRFFPTDPEWGIVPVWGFASVESSAHDDLAAGTRVYGFLPMASHAVVEPERVTGRGFNDGATHRAELPAIYNRYVLTDADPWHRPGDEAMLALFRPLFTTSFLLDDFIETNDGFGAGTVVLSSASSKTAYALAFLLAARGGRRVVGLTSAANAGFVSGLGCYDAVVDYDEVESIPAEDGVMFVDMAGDSEVTARLHRHAGAALRYSCRVGLTHWDRGTPLPELPGATPAFFFAPTHAQRRIEDWGPADFDARVAAAWADFLPVARDAVEVASGRGSDAVQSVYAEMLAGRASPAVGHLLSLA